tara:strand:+ start:3077 stop:4291 length:1215 start_codon:yes stop_codon:yes gene_type:complete
VQLYQLVYKSNVSEEFDNSKTEEFLSTIQNTNKQLDITGLLIFDGEHFLQVLEGPFDVISKLIASIQCDIRHDNVVILLKEPIPRREYKEWAMQLLIKKPDSMVKIVDETERLAQILDRYQEEDSGSRSRLIAKAFIDGAWAFNKEKLRTRKKIPLPIQAKSLEVLKSYRHNFAFQPIVDIELMKITSLEALIRGANGCSPYEVFAKLTPSELYQLDVDSKWTALEMFSEIDFDGFMSINLLPMSLLKYPDSVKLISQHAEDLGLNPNNVIIEITEQEAIDNHDEFNELANLIRSNGMRLAIDDFGAGYAGLSLLAEFQPHKLKIDRNIILGVANHGPRQAIVGAIMYVTSRLGIEVIAEGVDNEQDLRWLISAGITKIQGFYFAKPRFKGIPNVTWPAFLVND